MLGSLEKIYFKTLFCLSAFKGVINIISKLANN